MTRTICQVIDYGGTTGGSFIPALAALGRGAVARGDRFVVLASEIPGATWASDLTQAGAELRLVRGTADAATALRAVRPDIVHSHFTTYDLAVTQARNAAIYWHVHSVRENLSPVAELRAQLKYRVLARNVQSWLCVSGGIRSEVIARGAPAHRVKVVRNGVDTARFRPPSAREREESRARFNITSNERVLLFFDRTPVKGGTVLRRALTRLDGYRLLLNGGSPGEWESFKQSHRVIVAARHADPRPLYWAADALVLPSFGEGFSFVLAEAAACGLPVAASAIPPVQEMLGDTDDAFIFPVGDDSGAASAIERALRRTPSGSAREAILRGFSLGRWTSELLDLYAN